MFRKSILFALVAALAFSLSSGVKAGEMDGDSAMESSIYKVEAGDNELILRSGYYYQKATIRDGEDATEQGFLMGFGLSRFFKNVELFGAGFRTTFRIEPDFMIGFTDAADHTLHHFFVPVYIQADFPIPAETASVPMEVSAAVGTGLFLYDVGDKISSEKTMPAIGKFSVDYVRNDRLKMGVEVRGHYLLNNPAGAVEDLLGFSGVARLSFTY
ncbi:MAG: hypothetical protein ACR2NQ_05810 [Thermodesulfobacteriota bacterium]